MVLPFFTRAFIAVLHRTAFTPVSCCHNPSKLYSANSGDIDWHLSDFLRVQLGKWWEIRFYYSGCPVNLPPKVNESANFFFLFTNTGALSDYATVLCPLLLFFSDMRQSQHNLLSWQRCPKCSPPSSYVHLQPEFKSVILEAELRRMQCSKWKVKCDWESFSAFADLGPSGSQKSHGLPLFSAWFKLSWWRHSRKGQEEERGWEEEEKEEGQYGQWQWWCKQLPALVTFLLPR